MVCFAALALIACNKKPGIAELTSADGPVDRQEGTKGWAAAQIGTQFYLGDAARTADGGARLKLRNTTQQLAMQPSTILRFGPGKSGTVQLSVELGSVKLAGAGKLALNVGDVTLDPDGAIVITATQVQVEVGKIKVVGADGATQDLVAGQTLDLTVASIKVSAVIDAAVDAAPPLETPGDAQSTDGTAPQITVTGKRVEAQASGETKWKALPEGASTLDKGTKIRVGNASKARIVAHGTTLDLTTGSRAMIGDDLQVTLEVGNASASVQAANEGKVLVPGGEVGFKAGPQLPAEAKLDVTGRETKVTVVKPQVKLVGANGNELDMSGGVATVSKSGAIHQVEAIPSYFDMRVTVGETPTSFYVHDPKGQTALQFAFNGKCTGGGVIEMDRDSRFRTPKISGGHDSANMMATDGGWAWRLRCGDADGPAVASGRLQVRRDDGRRPLPKDPPVNTIDPDGRTYRVSYQSLVPNVKIKAGGPGTYKLHLATGGTEETFDSTTGLFTVPGSKLKEATYTYWIDRDGVKQDKMSTLIIDFNQTAPQVYIELPLNNQPFGDDVVVKGAVLPGWTAKVTDVEIPVDKNTRRFNATVQPPGDGAKALAIRLSHPRLGVHYYLRRGAK